MFERHRSLGPIAGHLGHGRLAQPFSRPFSWPLSAWSITRALATRWGVLIRDELVWMVLAGILSTAPSAQAQRHADTQIAQAPQAQGSSSGRAPGSSRASYRVSSGAVSIESTATWTDDVDMADYMQALTRLSPAATEGATAFMQAFLARCGRPLRTLELRRAVAEDAGDPVLMQMIRAAYEHDAAASLRLASQVDCSRYGAGKQAQGGGK